ncbi:MAG: C25 family cysteine peptidase [candidate division WOR-3 bacterium]
MRDTKILLFILPILALVSYNFAKARNLEPKSIRKEVEVLTNNNGKFVVLNASDSGITFQFFTKIDEKPKELPLEQNGKRALYHQIELAGCERLMASVGNPDLPMCQVLVGIPQTGSVYTQVKTAGIKIYHNINIAPVPKLTWSDVTFEPAGVYNQNQFYPEEVVAIKEIGYWRDVRVAKLIISPAQFNPVQKELILYETLTVSVNFSQKPQTFQHKPDVFDRIYERTLLNGTKAKFWRIPSSASTQKQTTNFFSTASNWIKIKIESTGVYKISYQDLKNLNLNLRTINPKTFRLFNIGKWSSNLDYPDTMVEIPIYVYGEQDSSFDAQDYIIFYGNSVSDWDSAGNSFQTNYFTNYNCYWLTYGTEPGLRIPTLSAPPSPNFPVIHTTHSKIHYEQDKLCPARSGLLWLWENVTKAVDQSEINLEIPIVIPNLDSIEKIRIALYQPETNLSANFNVYLNEIMVGTGQFRTARYTPYIWTKDSLPKINSDQNTLRIQLFGSGEMQLYLDYIDVFYCQKLNLNRYDLTFTIDSLGNAGTINVKEVTRTPIILDITDRRKPKLITNFIQNSDSLLFRVEPSPQIRCYHITDLGKLKKPVKIELRQPGKLKTNPNRVDYYIIAPDELYPSAQLIAQYRTNNITNIPNARADAVKLSNIYDDYSFGIEEPGAIRQFFKDKRPIYGLLVGDATYDYKNNLGFNDFPMLPAYEQGFDFDPDVYSMQALALDVYYARLDNDQYPDMILGRITARTDRAVREFLNKVKEYELKPDGFWNSRLLLLADDEWVGAGKPDQGMIWTHIIDCEAIANAYQDRLEPVKVYLTEYPFAPSTEYAKPQARTSFIQALNQGALLLYYFGHGAGWQLAHEKAFYVEEDVVKVNNGRRNPFAFFGSCGVGRFEDTRYQAIAEELVRKPDGCIGTIGATKATSAGTNLYFALALTNIITDTFPVTIGEAFFGAWTYDTKYHLFGDPATVLNLPQTSNVRFQVIPDTFRLGEVCSLICSIPSIPANYYLTVYGPKWLRTYSSYFNNRVNTINYQLPGYELFRGVGKVRDSQLFNRLFIIPRGQNEFMRGDGYTQIANSARIGLGYTDSRFYYYATKDSVPISYDTTPRVDTVGPMVNLYASGKLLANGSLVPEQFFLSGTLYDISGILILTNTVTGCSLFFYDPASDVPIGLGEYFIYDNNSYTQGRFTYPEPLRLTKSTDTLVVMAYDCLLNQTKIQLELNLQKPGLRILDALVYPNPVKTKTYFTFKLTKSAVVRVSVYTINGRLVKRLGPVLCSSGYNQIEWDGRDETGVYPANGVYLYTIKATYYDDAGQGITTTVTEKILISR